MSRKATFAMFAVLGTLALGTAIAQAGNKGNSKSLELESFVQRPTIQRCQAVQ